MIFPANLSTGAKRPAFCTDDINKTKYNYNQKQHKNPNNHARKLLTYSQTTANETKTNSVYTIQPGNG